MPENPDAMSIADATMTMLLLTEWTPPSGLTVTISSSCRPERPDGRIVNVVLSAVEHHFCVINVGRVPDAAAFDALTKAARLILDAAWEQPACLGLGAAPEPGENPVAIPLDFLTPGGPLDLRSSPHPIYNTDRFGRDV